MKVAIIGNMNNNNFSLLRYLRDLGINAKLFLFKNDGTNESSHFSCSADTFELDKWSPYITRTEILNSQVQILGTNFFFNFLFYIIYILHKVFFKKKQLRYYPSIFGIKKYIKKTFKDFDVLIGTGNTPAIFYSSGLQINIFAPCSFGIEYFDCINTKKLISSNFFVIRYFAKKMKKFQLNGMKNSKIINTQFGVTLESLEQNKLYFYPIDYPMVYLSKSHLLRGEDSNLDIINKINEYDFVVLSHSRHLWVKPESSNFNRWDEYANKNNNWLINSFSRTIKEFPKKSILLILFEYGPNVEETKKLCKTAGIEKNVVWIPIMNRRDILVLINRVNVVASEFYSGQGIMWGGTGWETLIMGKPLIVGFNFPNNSFKKLFGFDPPPVFGVKKEKDIFSHLVSLINSPELEKKNGVKNKEWFYKYNGYIAAKKWVNLFEEN
tara:strand:+ start:18632 stop:19945 length:1314 start_codon:yes stop_codon:yes gene_type:complete